MTAYLLMGDSRKYSKVKWGGGCGVERSGNDSRIGYFTPSLLKQLGSEVRSRVGSGGAPAENEYGAFLASQNTFGQVPV